MAGENAPIASRLPSSRIIRRRITGNGSGPSSGTSRAHASGRRSWVTWWSRSGWATPGSRHDALPGFSATAGSGACSSGQSSLDLEWDWFCAVALGRSLAHPGLTTVSTNHFQAVELAWREAVARGFRRIGLVLSEHEDVRTADTLRAA